MFDDHQDQTHNTDNGVTGASAAPAVGIGMNPNPTYIPPSDSTTPTVVLPSSHTMASAPGSADPVAASAPTPAAPVSVTPQSSPAALPSDLEELKRHALAELSPLVSKLEQTPEEKYKTIMMMIQASDNQSLLNEAYETAQKIADEKARAEALLNIVNEINYFAQKAQV